MPIPLQPGQPMPAVAGPTQSGTPVSTETFRGRWVVLYFYPKDNTSGCTREAQAFNASLERFRAEGAEVIGVSVDSVASHRRFADMHGLRFPLISDADRQISTRLGVLNEKGTSARRTTFLVDPEGRLAKVFENVRVDGHVEQVLEAIRNARAGQGNGGSDLR